MTSKNPRTSTAGLDGTDLAILAELAADGRITNAALAARVGVAESTCMHRVRALRESGVISGFYARFNLTALGLPIQAVIKVRLGSHKRDDVLRFHARLAKIPGVLTAFHVAGEDDYLLHVAVESPGELRDLVLEHLTVHPSVRHTETQLVFEVLPGIGVLPQPGGRTSRGSRQHD
ncbi:Lrp/AsnC family transcriptional regulator [Haloechinothrix sp. LS1_15]|uniref:Lrp/AsnC family transcriptional regulator n=1 Tax=Haloechinothrix sp. LS1_15 TaxID=2652248 RepID=UPI002947FB73|nr:Lrp/AsnC family transcriptional regulator [Haloechinothrix sp. LS1_15]MDV6011979.1 Lrp/AsnC family transcriptional regulator [Haloechinothrix sp. LS1_15]